MFDADNPVSHVGLVPLMESAEQADLPALVGEHVRFIHQRAGEVGSANATPKLTAIVAGMAAGADSIDCIDVIRPVG